MRSFFFCAVICSAAAQDNACRDASLSSMLCTPAGKPPNVAVCISGAARTFERELVHRSLKENLIDRLGAPTTVFAYLKLADARGDNRTAFSGLIHATERGVRWRPARNSAVQSSTTQAGPAGPGVALSTHVEKAASQVRQAAARVGVATLKLETNSHTAPPQCPNYRARYVSTVECPGRRKNRPPTRAEGDPQAPDVISIRKRITRASSASSLTTRCASRCSRSTRTTNAWYSYSGRVVCFLEACRGTPSCLGLSSRVVLFLDASLGTPPV